MCQSVLEEENFALEDCISQNTKVSLSCGVGVHIRPRSIVSSQ